MHTFELPSRPNLGLYRKLAKDLVRIWKSGQPEKLHWDALGMTVTRDLIAKLHPRLAELSLTEIQNAKFALADAQFIIARAHGFESWPKFAKHVDRLQVDNPYRDFLRAACSPLHSGHATGNLDEAQTILAEHPEIAAKDIFTASILGDAESVARFLERNPKNAQKKGGPHRWDALTYLCFSRYLRLDNSKSDGFVRSARALLEAGANINTGWFETTYQEWESVLYGASAVAQNAELTQLLLDYGANPNDEETPYHSAETYKNDAVAVLISSGKMTEDSLATVLLRKTDWHDYDGIKLLLEHGADPNRMTRWHHTALQHAIRRDNRLANIELLLDHGADPLLENRADGRSSVSMAMWRGRKDLLELFAHRGVDIIAEGVERLIMACALNEQVRVASAVPSDVQELLREGGTLLAEFAGNGNAVGVGHLLDLGVPVDALYKGDGYFEIAPDSTALHVAAWKAQHAAVKLLVERGAAVDAIDGRGRTPLMLAVRACVDSHWTNRRSPESVRILLEAGASRGGLEMPSGYHEIDSLFG